MLFKSSNDLPERGNNLFQAYEKFLKTSSFWIVVLAAFAAALVSCSPRINFLPNGGIGIGFQSGWKSIYKSDWKAENWFEGEKTLALCHAIVKQDVKKMQRLIDEGADVNVKGKENMPLLLWAYPSGEQVLECLLKNGADPNVILESNYKTPKFSIVPGNTLLFLAIRSSAGGNPKFRNYVDLFLKFWANPNMGRPSPLAYAAGDPAYEEAFQSLIKVGADPNYNAGDTDYLRRSANRCNTHHVNILLEHGANYDINTEQGAMLQRYLYRAKTEPDFLAYSSNACRKETKKAIDWLEAHGVSFDEPAPLLPEEIERREKERNRLLEEYPPKSPNDSETVNDAK